MKLNHYKDSTVIRMMIKLEIFYGIMILKQSGLDCRDNK